MTPHLNSIRCNASADKKQTIRCEHVTGHVGPHESGGFRWANNVRVREEQPSKNPDPSRWCEPCRRSFHRACNGQIDGDFLNRCRCPEMMHVDAAGLPTPVDLPTSVRAGAHTRGYNDAESEDYFLMREAFAQASWNKQGGFGREPSVEELDAWLMNQPTRVRRAFLRVMREDARRASACVVEDHRREIDRLQQQVREASVSISRMNNTIASSTLIPRRRKP